MFRASTHRREPNALTFVFSNPGHHLEMMLPVARAVTAAGVPTKLISLAELRGFATPKLDGIACEPVIPWRIRKDPSAGASLGASHRAGHTARQLARRAAWCALGPRLSWLLRRSEIVVVPNDAAYPYDALARMLRARGVPFVLIQEGIRFPLPTERAAGTIYGAGGADMICAWGEASAEHFQSVADTSTIRITGTPRWDGVAGDAWVERGRALRERLGLAERPLLYLSNTIDDQGFCTTDEKVGLFAGFVERAAPVLAAESRGLVVKLHPREDPEPYTRIALRTTTIPVHVVNAPLFEVLASGQAAVVLASTVGLEALAFGLPLGVLEIPGHGHVFEYVARGAAIGLTLAKLEHQLSMLLHRRDETATSAFLERHLAHRGSAADRIANELIALHSRRTTARDS